MSLSIEDIMYKYKLFWQFPVITEKSFYEQYKNNSNFLGFPWATIIDRKLKIEFIFDILKSIVDLNKQYFTCCQHILYRRMVPLFKLLNITTIYACHKTKTVNCINGITIKPCPLYAVNVEDFSRNKEFVNVDFVNCKRNYLYSFLGAYQNNYLTKIRLYIFNLPIKDDVYIENIGKWHFNPIVYSKLQNYHYKEDKSVNHIENTSKYNDLLINSRFSLCPSGTGPNSIRFWESLATGSIPILLADTLDLPPHELWKDSIILLPESDINNVDIICRSINAEKENIMRRNCLRIYHDFKNNYTRTIE